MLNQTGMLNQERKFKKMFDTLNYGTELMKAVNEVSILEVNSLLAVIDFNHKIEKHLNI